MIYLSLRDLQEYHSLTKTISKLESLKLEYITKLSRLNIAHPLNNALDELYGLIVNNPYQDTTYIAKTLCGSPNSEIRAKYDCVRELKRIFLAMVKFKEQRKQYQDTLDWFVSSRNNIFSFSWCCEVSGINKKLIKQFIQLINGGLTFEQAKREIYGS